MRRVLRKNKQAGFILYSTVISITISTIILSILLSVIFYAVMWDAKLLDSVSMMEDGRYTRRMVVAHIMWNKAPVTVEDANQSLMIHDNKRTTFVIRRHALYRKLTDGSLQPVSGSRIIGTADKRHLDHTRDKGFAMDEYGVVHLHWFINNRFAKEKSYTEGYGGIAGYEVATGRGTIFNWYIHDENEGDSEHRDL